MTRRRPDRTCRVAGALRGAVVWLTAIVACTSPPAADRLQTNDHVGRTTPAHELADQRGCLSCHGLVRKQVGPGFAQIAQRYRGDPEAAGRLVAKVRNGSVGNWGRVIMPAQTRVSEAEAGALVAWVLSQPDAP